jgi:hypothetical protein
MIIRGLEEEFDDYQRTGRRFDDYQRTGRRV